MATINLTFSTGDQTRIVNAICSLKGYLSTIPDAPGVPGGPNPESKSQFTTRMIREDIKKYVLQYEKVLSDTTASSNFTNTFIQPDIT